MIKQELQEELKKSMLAKNEIRISVLRMLLSAITYYEIQKGGAGYQATSDDILSVIEKEIKQRKDSMEQYKLGNRQDLVDKEEKELAILKSFLPEQISEKELNQIIQEIIKITGAKDINEMGKVMKEIMPKIKGRADAILASQIVKKSLSS